MIAAFVRTCRPSQWTKNLVVFAAVLFARKVDDPRFLGSAALAFWLFSFLASAVYVVNDVLDREADRDHPTKRTRPIAAWTLPVGVALAAGCTSPYVELCERGAVCRGANDRDIDACIVEQEEREEVASIFGCDDQWNAYVDCMVDRGTCSGGDRLSGCDDLKDTWRRCVE